MSHKKCTPAVTDEWHAFGIESPQIIGLKQYSFGEPCGWKVVPMGDKNLLQDQSSAKMISLSYHDINVPSGIDLLIYSYRLNQKRSETPLRVLKGPLILNKKVIDEASPSAISNVYNIESSDCHSTSSTYHNCANELQKGMPMRDVVQDSVVGNELHFYVQNTTRGSQYLVETNTFSVLLVETATGNGVSVAAVVGSVIASLLFLIAIVTYFRRKRYSHDHPGQGSVIVPVNFRRDDEDDEDDEDKPIPATTSLIRVSTNLYVYKKAQFQLPGGNNDDQDCPVCLDKFREGQRVRMLPCSHLFHIKCSDIWLRKNCTCPMCKADIAITALNVKTHSDQTCNFCKKSILGRTAKTSCPYKKLQDRYLTRVNTYKKAEIYEKHQD